MVKLDDSYAVTAALAEIDSARALRGFVAHNGVPLAVLVGVAVREMVEAGMSPGAIAKTVGKAAWLVKNNDRKA